MTAPDRPFLTIVSGLPRSGTSLMMKMLEAGGLPVLVDNVREADVDNPKGYYEFEPVKALKADASWVAPARRQGRQDGLPPPDGPAARSRISRLVHASESRRGPRLAEGDARPDGQARARSTTRRWRPLFRDQFAKFDAWVKGRPNFRVLDVNHRGLVTDAAPILAEVDRFLGGGLDLDAMARVVDPTLYRNRGT